MSNAIMDALGYVGDSLDKPGRAVRGVLAGKGREALAAVPFSDSLGITDAKDRTSGRDLTDAYGLTRSGSRSFGSHALGFGAEMLTDPLNLVAGYGAFRAAPTLAKGLTSAGKAVSGLDLLDAFHGAGKGARNLLRSEEGSLHAFPSEWGHSIDNWHAGLEPPKPNVIDGQPDTLLNHLPWGGEDNVPQSWKVAASAAGPRYEGGLDKLQEALQGNQYKHANKLLYHPNASRIAEEIPEGTKYLGNGAEAIAFKAPDGHVIRVAPHVSEFGSAGRADMPEILQPFRSQRIEHINRYGEHQNPWIVEHLPEVDPLLMSRDSRNQFTKILEGMYRAHGHDATTASQFKYLQARQTIDPDKLRILGDELSARVAGVNPQLDPWDFHEGNIAATREGNLIGHDGGMVKMLPSSNKTIERWSAPDHLDDPGHLEAVLKAGGPDAVREAIANGNALGTFGQGAIPGKHVDLTEYTQAQALVREFLGKNAHYANAQTPHSVPGVDGFRSSPVSDSWANFKTPASPDGDFLANPLNVRSGSVVSGAPSAKPAAQSIHTKGPDNWNPDNIDLIKRGLPGMDIEAIKKQVEGNKLGWFGVDDLIRDAKQNLARPAQEPPLSFHIGDTPAGGQRNPNQSIPLGGAWANNGPAKGAGLAALLAAYGLSYAGN
jgi:hypothetical protein